MTWSIMQVTGRLNAQYFWRQPIRLVCLLAAVLPACRQTGNSSTAFKPLAIGDVVPPYAARVLSSPADKPHLDSVRIGPQEPLTLLNVWATWCTSCREEMADLNTLQQVYGGRDLRVIGVSIDQGSEARVARFAAANRLAFTVALDPDQRIQEAYQVVGVPSTYLIDRGGRVLWTHIGPLGRVVPQLKAIVDSALAS